MLKKQIIWQIARSGLLKKSNAKLFLASSGIKIPVWVSVEGKDQGSLLPPAEKLNATLNE